MNIKPSSTGLIQLNLSGSTVQTSSIQHSTDIVNKDYVDTHHGGGGGGNPNPTQNIN